MDRVCAELQRVICTQVNAMVHGQGVCILQHL